MLYDIGKPNMKPYLSIYCIGSLQSGAKLWAWVDSKGTPKGKDFTRLRRAVKKQPTYVMRQPSCSVGQQIWAVQKQSTTDSKQQFARTFGWQMRLRLSVKDRQKAQLRKGSRAN